VPESEMPSVMTYPRYSIVSGDRTTLIHEGTICGAFSTEACEEVLPYDGRFVFRVAGYSEDPDEVRWDFCGESGILGEEVEFEMVKGKCVVVEKRTAEDYCQGIESISVWSGSLLLSGPSSSSSSSSLGVDDSRVLERTLSELLFHSEVHIDSSVCGESGLTVSFSSTIILEQLGYVGVYWDEVEVAEEFIETSVSNAMSTGVVLASFQNILYQDPSLSSGVIGQTTAVSLLEFEMTSLSYQTRTSSTSNDNDSENEKDPNGGESGADNNNNKKEKSEETSMDELTHFSLVGYVSGGIALAFLGVMLLFLLKSNSPSAASVPSCLDPESSHSLLVQKGREDQKPFRVQQ
jgi:hypothetical protein